jgi:hypothetical protein
MPPCIEPERGQVPENLAKSGPRRLACTEESGDVLNQDPSGSKLANDAGELRPEPPLVVLGLPAAGSGYRLAWESAADEVNASVSVTPM